ncbi:hypothetical protein [Mycobacterium sp.]|jgi:hypothetical protein|uniref:hypothetical protein n=1 Tax=Mycobacterium sp. TaxID=1785 RepID=UPI000CB77CBE|nr:hypothetical protein [Mycobacterium sp.]MBI2699767.1 hypothetical protein [Mycobacterium sp.]PJE11827.1 MAG: hypothetical protein CK428_13590 [Mycobacterium sp.]
MTTHDQRTDMTGSYDDTQRTVQPTPPAEERVQPQQQAPAFSETEPLGEAAAPVQQPHEAGHEASRSSTEETLFADADLADLRARWAGVQAAFVDDPKDCVQKADVLVSDLVDQLTTGFAHARSRLEEQWSRGEEASTEDLRLALMHYREFFERLLAV